MQLRDIHHYDTYVPILSELETRHTWEQAVKLVLAALEPLGQRVLRRARSGARTAAGAIAIRTRASRAARSAAGSFDGDPYILMNYQPDVLDHVFTLAHEAGHSMHSYYSAKHQPFQYYNYTIFVAEVASTFNEQLLTRHLMQKATSDKQRAFLINREIDAIRGTIIRQTMFAEFEKHHARAGRGGRAADRRTLQERIPQAARALLRARLRARRRTVAGMLPHSAFLSGVLRLQVRHRACRPRSPWPSA